MANTIDNRVVSMQFDNAQFESRIATTTQSLKDLNKSLQLNGAADALKGVSAAASSSAGPLSGIAAGVENISSKFSLLGAIGFTMIQDLTRSFISMSVGLYNAIVTPIIQGGKQRALNIEQAKFQFKGLGMNVEKTMSDALYAVKDTAYALDEAATAASMLGASGVKAGAVMRASLRGISGMAAISGQSYSRIADVMTSVAGQGRVTGDTFFRLGQVGVNAAAILGKALGKNEAEVRKMASKGQIDFKTFAIAMDKAFGPHAKEANKTFQGALSNTRTALARLGAVWYGGPPTGKNKGINEAMRIGLLAIIPVIDDITTAVTPFLILVTEGMKTAATSLSKFLAVFKKAEGIEAFGHLGQALINIFWGFMSVLDPVKNAFLEVFPPKTFKDFHDFAVGIQELTNKLFPSKALIEHITTAFKGLFSIFALAGKGIKFIADVLYTIFDTLFVSTGIVSGISGGLGVLSDTIFGFFTNLNSGADTSHIFKNALEVLRNGLNIIATPFKFVGGLIESFVGWLAKLGTAFTPATNSVNAFGKVAAVFESVLRFIVDTITGAFSILKKVLSPIIDGVNRAISTLTFDDLIKAVLTFFAAGTLANMSAFFSKFIVMISRFLPRFSGITNQFKLMLASFSAQINAQTLKTIAVSVLIFAGAMFVISMIDPDRLAGATAGIVALMTGVMVIIQRFSKMQGSGVGVIKASIALNILTTALIGLSLAVLILGTMKPEQLAQGLLGVGTLLAGLDLFAHYLKTDAQMVSAGAGMVLMGVGLLIMGAALKLIGTMDPGDLVKAMLAIGGLFAFVIAINYMITPADIAKVGLDMILLAGSIAVMAGALRLLGGMSLETLGVGLLGMAGGLGLMIATLHLMPENSQAKVVDLIIVAGAVYILGLALVKIGSLSMDQLAVALLGLTLSLLLIEGVLLALSDSKILIGAAALLIVSGALWVLAGVIAVLGLIPVENIAKAVVTIAAVLLTIGLAGLVLEAGLTGILGLGAAILMIGASIFLAGIGVGMFAAGIALLATTLAVGGPVLIAFLVSFAQTMPILAYNLALALGAFIKGLVDQSASITASLIGLFNIVLNALITILPQIMGFLGQLFAEILNFLVVQTPVIVTALLTMLMALLTGIVTFMPQIIAKGGEIVVAFINGMSDSLGKIITAGTKFIIKLIKGIANSMLDITTAAMETVVAFINGLADAIRANTKSFNDAANNLLGALWDALTTLLGSTFNFVKIGLQIGEGIAKGIGDAVGSVVDAAGKLASDVWTATCNFFHIGSPSKLFMTIGKALVDGMVVGLEQNKQTSVNAAVNVAKATHAAFEAASNAALDVFNGVIEPRISPVVDLDAVYAGAKAISSLMSDASAAKVTADVGARMGQTINSEPATTDEAPRSTDVTFIQNNNSPKSLSRLEIYRQTQNQLQVLKGFDV